jgi:hypothetical protein
MFTNILQRMEVQVSYADFFLYRDCHEMNNYFKALKIKSLLSLYALIVSKKFCCLVMEKIKD